MNHSCIREAFIHEPVPRVRRPTPLELTELIEMIELPAAFRIYQINRIDRIVTLVGFS